MKLFTEFKLGNTTLKNRIVMAPMTRSRAIGNIPNDLIAEYYGQRASAGLIITEGTSPSANGLGYARIPGIYSAEQVAGWKKTTDAVHAKGGKIFIQLMHTGRIAHGSNLPEGAKVVAPSAIKAAGQMWSDTEGMQDHPTPEALTAEGLKEAMQEYVDAAKNAIEAGFDGVELHAANGYLLDQFLNPQANQRTDEYGGSADKRNRFVIETAQAVADAIGTDRTGIRISPYGAFNDLHAFDGVDDQYNALAKALGEIGLVYIHIVDHSAQGAPEVPQRIKDSIRANFGSTIIVSGGLDKAKAEAELQAGHGELAAFGRPFIGNPDLVERLQHDLPLAEFDATKLYTADADGFTTYTKAEAAKQQ